jgi:glycosyltransferase involved in cell wall biosynthesis
VKIIHIADSMEVGGAEKLISLLCRWQHQQGHEASVHCLYEMGALGKQLRKDGFEVVVHNATRTGGRPADLYRAIKQRTPDVVHCHNAAAAILGALPARMAGVQKIVVTRHGMVAPPYFLRQELKFAFAARWCDWIVAVCERARRNLMAAPFSAQKKVVRIYNAALAPHCDETSSPPKSGFTLLHIGRLNPVKDQETLLRGFALARSRVRDLRLWIVGGGDLRPKLERLARESGLTSSVTFFGEQEDVAPFIRAADLFILSSISEGIPLSLLEALAAGVPSVVTNVGGMSEVAGLSQATITVPPSTPAALAVAIEKMAQSRDQLNHLGNIARECHAAHFTVERMAGQYMELYSGHHAA